MKKVSYDDIFVVLTYRNTTDVIDFLDSLRGKIERYKVVIVNSYFDDITYSCIRKIAYEYGCDFINIQNKGYGYGNNKGIEYVKKMYNFKRVVISNPDIIVREYNQNKLDEFKDGIIGGDIVCRNGKHQNPLRVTNLSISLYAAYYLYSMNSKFGLSGYLRQKWA